MYNLPASQLTLPKLSPIEQFNYPLNSKIAMIAGWLRSTEAHLRFVNGRIDSREYLENINEDTLFYLLAFKRDLMADVKRHTDDIAALKCKRK
jgi:hypothetical protein